MPDCLQRLAELRDRGAVLDRIPERIDAARPAPVRAHEPVDEAVELALLLEGRIDQHQPALFLRRQMRAERQPAVELDGPDLEIAGEQRLQPLEVLAGAVRSPTAGPAAAGDGARSAASRDISRRRRRDWRPSPRRDRAQAAPAACGGKLRLQQPADAVKPFAGLLRLLRRQIVEAGAGMGVDDAERLVLAASDIRPAATAPRA